jgi:hypothetical protein
MPALPVVPNVLKASFQHLYGGINAWVHWYFKYSGTPPATADAAAIANSLKATYNTNAIPLMATNCTLNLIQVTDLSSATGAQNVSSGTLPGTRVGGPMTADACVLFNQHLARRYRGGKPRQYWPWGVASDLNGPITWATAFQTSCTSAYNAMVTAANAITWTGGNIVNPVNVSYFQGFKVVTSASTGRARNVPLVRATPLVDNIVSASVNPKPASQRRRLHFSA